MFSYPVFLCREYNFIILYIRSMADKRKSLFKHPYQCRRSRKSTPDLFTPYLPSPELMFLPLMSMNQTVPVFSVSRSFSNLTSTPSAPSGSSSFINSIAPFDLGLGSWSSSFLHTNSSVAEDLWLDQHHTQFFHHEWIGVGPQGLISHIQPLFLPVLQLQLLEILLLLSRDFIKTLNFQIIHWTYFLVDFLMSPWAQFL